MIKKFTDLEAWKINHALVILIYKITKSFPKDELFGLVSQMRRAAVSITSNIAEGFGRGSKVDKVRFYQISRGSLYELESQILILRDVNYISDKLCQELLDRITECTKIIHGLIRSAGDKNILVPNSEILNTKEVR